MTPGKRPFQPVTLNDVLGVYELLLKSNLVSFPVTEEAKHKIEALIASITEPHFGVDFYPSVEEKTVAHLFFIIKSHAFTDGNKRTASMAFLTLCGTNGLTPDFTKFG